MARVASGSAGQWWTSTGYRPAAEEQARLDGGKTGHDDPLIDFYDGVPRPLAEAGRTTPSPPGTSAEPDPITA